MPRPAVKVFQKLVSVSPAILTPFFELCVVGPIYQVVRDKEFVNKDESATVADYRAGETFISNYVDQELNTNIDEAYVKCTINDPLIKIWPAYVAASDVIKKEVQVDNTAKVTTLSFTSVAAKDGFLDSNAKAGDVVYLTYVDGGSTKTFTASIQTVVDNLTVKLNKNVPSPSAGTITTFDADVTIVRPYDVDLTLETNPAPVGGRVNGVKTSATGVELDALLTVPVWAGTYRVFAGKVTTTYRALKSYMSGDFSRIREYGDVDAKIGKLDIDNPMSVAANVVFSNANVAFNVLGVETDDNQGYLRALDLLGTNDKIYVIVPLTQDKDVVTAYSNHCKAMGTGEKSKWRIAYCNMKMPLTKVLVENNACKFYKGVAESVATILDEADGKFMTNRCIPGDFIDVYTEAAGVKTLEYSLMLKTLENDSVVTCYTDVYDKTESGYVKRTSGVTTVPTTAIVDRYYEVVRKLDTSGIAAAITEIAQSFSNKRLRLVMPDLVRIEVNEVDYDLPGYYLCVAYGAMRAGFPPHQGFTTLGVGGIKRIFHANRYFKDDDLDYMSDRGVFWTVQDEPDALPYCLHQTTTDTTQLETIEDSVVATVDFASKYYKDNLKAVLGKFNVNEISVKYVSTVVKDITERMQRMSYPYIGSVILGGRLKSMTTEKDKIKPVVGIQVPFPVNEVEMTLEV